MEDKLRIKGKVNWKVIGEDGIIKQEGETHNLVLTEGDDFIADRISTTPAITQMGYMVLGIGGTTASKAFTWVQTGWAGNSHALDATYPKLKSGDANSVEYVCTFHAGDATKNAINEIIISNVASSGTGADPGSSQILAYCELSPSINKGASDAVVFTWTITVTGS
jgi:hypothetical protein